MLRRVGARAAAAALVSFAATTAISEPGRSPRGDGTGRSPFSYRELDTAILRRREQERALADYVNTISPMLNAARSEMAHAHRVGDKNGVERAQQRFSRLASLAQAETAALTWGSADGERKRKEFVERFGCVGWTDAAVTEIVKHSPLIEIGAGKGQWQRELANAGADIVAFDNMESVPGGMREPSGGVFGFGKRDVRKKQNTFNGVVASGDENALTGRRILKQNRTLLVVFPEGDLLLKCLGKYKGDVVLFVGEGRGGVNGGERVFDCLEENFKVEKVIEVAPFGDGHERLWVLRRRGERGRVV